MKAEWIQGFATMCVLKKIPTKKAKTITFKHSHLLPYLQKLNRRWRGIDPRTFNTSHKCVFQLHTMLKRRLKKPDWLQMEMEEAKLREHDSVGVS